MSQPCPWCGTPVAMNGYRSPVEHPCDFSLVCGAPTTITVPTGVWWARLNRCRNPRSESDGRCYAHTGTARFSAPDEEEA